MGNDGMIWLYFIFWSYAIFISNRKEINVLFIIFLLYLNCNVEIRWVNFYVSIFLNNFVVSFLIDFKILFFFIWVIVKL